MTLSPGYGGDLDSLCADWTMRQQPRHPRRRQRGVRTRNAQRLGRLGPVSGGQEASYAYCAAAHNYRPGTILYADLRAGDRYCALTSDRRCSALTVVFLERSGSARAIRLRVHTWSPVEADAAKVDYSWLLPVLLLVLVAGGGGAAASKAKRRTAAESNGPESLSGDTKAGRVHERRRKPGTKSS